MQTEFVPDTFILQLQIQFLQIQTEKMVWEKVILYSCLLVQPRQQQMSLTARLLHQYLDVWDL